MAEVVQTSELDLTRHGLENGLRVRHIMTEKPITVIEDQDIEEIRQSKKFKGFDHLPVRDTSGQIIGRLDQHNMSGSGTVREAMVPLTGDMLVSADQSLAHFLPTMRKHSCRLVVEGEGISAIVTRSDLQKMPVRLLAFSLVSHLEQLMFEEIELLYDDDEEQSLDCLDPAVAKRVRGLWSSAKVRGLDLGCLEYTDFGHKVGILSGTVNAKLTSDFEGEVSSVKELRNDVAHRKEYMASTDKLNEFLDSIRTCNKWIGVFLERRRLRAAT